MVDDDTLSRVRDQCDYTCVDPRWVQERLSYHLRDLTTRIDVEPTPLHPIFVAREAYADVIKGTLAVLEPARRLVNRLLQLGVYAASELLGVDELYARLMVGCVDSELAAMDVMARPDIVFTQDGPKIIELNVGGSFGGVVEYQSLMRAWREIYPSAAWDAMSPVNPIEQRARFLLGAFRASGACEAHMVGEMADHVHSRTSRYLDLDLDAVRERGLPMSLSGADKVGEIMLGRPPGSVMAYANFSPAEWHSRGVSLDPVEKFIRDGGILIPSMLSILMNSKAVLAYISAGVGLSPNDAASVARYVPWTRIVSTRRVEAGVSLDAVLENQESLVLKKSLSLRSEHVIVGRYSSASTWRSAAQRAARGGWIAQEWAEPVALTCAMSAEPGSGSAKARGIRCIISPIVIGGESQAVYSRYRVDDLGGGIINAGSNGSMENIVVPLG